jgi:hypothetical protein
MREDELFWWGWFDPHPVAFDVLRDSLLQDRVYINGDTLSLQVCGVAFMNH